MKNIVEPRITPQFDRVACCVSGSALSVVRTAVQQEDLRVVEFDWRKLIGLNESSTQCSLLIYDLNPWDDRAIPLLKHAAECAPRMGVLLCPPARQSIGYLLEAAIGLELRKWEPQPLRISNLRSRIREMISGARHRMLARLLKNALPDVHQRIEQFVLLALQDISQLHHGERACATKIALRSGVTVRTLERLTRRHAVPPPGELVSWLRLLYIEHSALTERTSAFAVARNLGWSRSAVYRLRRRLLGSQPMGMQEASQRAVHDLFDCVLLAFCERCGKARPSPTILSEVAGR